MKLLPGAPAVHAPIANTLSGLSLCCGAVDAVMPAFFPTCHSAGTSGWHTHATDYAVDSLEPSCLFRVLRDGRHIALASVAGNGLLLCANGSNDALGLAACNPGGWVGAGAAWERRDGAICNSRWPDKVRRGTCAAWMRRVLCGLGLLLTMTCYHAAPLPVDQTGHVCAFLQALAVRVLHVTCLPTLQLQRVEEVRD